MGHGGRGQNPIADLIVLVGLHQRVALHDPLLVAASQLGQLQLEFHKRFKDPIAGLHPGDQGVEIRLAVEQFGALAVVAPGGGLRHEGESQAVRQQPVGCKVAPGWGGQMEPL